MDVTSALRGEAFRPFATVVAPGALGLAPWTVLLYSLGTGGHAFWDKHPIAMGVGLFIASLAAGLLFENIGARIEAAIDKRIDRVDRSHMETWYSYLLLCFEIEPIGQRYLRTVVFHLKFELGFLASLLLQLPGWLSVLWTLGAPPWSLVVSGLLGGAVAYWLYREAVDSAKVLGRLRRDLVNAYRDTTTLRPVVQIAAPGSERAATAQPHGK